MDSKTRIFDMHCDTLDRLAWPTLPASLNCGEFTYAPDDEGVAQPGVLQDFASARGHLSLERMGSFAWTQCLATFIPDTLSPEESLEFFTLIQDSLAEHVGAHPDLLGIARDVREVDDILASGRTAGVLTIEGGTVLAAAPDMVERIAQAGIKMLTLTWNAPNPLGSGHDTEEGLTSFGRRMVSELEAHRIVVDVSHLNDPGFDDLLKVVRQPFAASHSNSRAVCDVPRNLTDDQFRAIRDSGGVVGLNFCDHFITLEHADPTVDDVLAHVEHWLDLDGENVIALGTDYDGCNTPSWLAGCEKMGNLEAALTDRFGETIARKLLSENAHAFFVRNETA